MRILHIFDHSLPLQSGYVTRSLGILRSQRARGWQTIHVTSPRHAAWTQQSDTCEQMGELSFYRTPGPGISLPILRECAEMYTLRRRLLEIVRDERPDILHAHSPVLNVLPAIEIGRRFGLPVVYEIRAFWEDAAVENGRLRTTALRYSVARRLDTWAMRHVDAVLPICEPLRAELIERGIPADRVTVVPNAVNPYFLTAALSDGNDLRHALGITDLFIIGFIGSFYGYEGLDLLLEAVAQLRTQIPSLCVLLVGGGPDEPRIRSLVAENGLQPWVRLVGRVKLEEVKRYYQIVDLFVFPRRRMRLTELVTPLKPLEAMAQSKPVAASDVGGHRELIRHGETGYLFPPDDAAALGASLRAIVADAAGRARIAENGRKFVEKDRNWDAVVTRYSAIYDAVLSRGGGLISESQDRRVRRGC